MKTENLSHAWNVAAVRVAVLLSVLLLSFAAKADFTKGYINYRVLENGDEVEVCGGTVYYNKVSIPEKVTYGPKTYTVTRIAENAFEGKGSLWYLEIPNTVTEIGAYAFSNCRLRSVTIPPSVKVIGEYAFEGINPPTPSNPHDERPKHDVDVQISDLAAWCDIDFANEYSNPLSTGIEYGTTGWYSKFYLNGELIIDLVIPDGVTTIKQYAFCKNFRSVTFPPSVKEMANAFQGSPSHHYTDAIYLSDLAAWCQVTGYILPGAENLYLNGELVTDLVIPEGVTSISKAIFNRLESITSVTIPNTVTEIGESAFNGCKYLKTVSISNSVTEIQKNAFAFCGNLETVTIGNSIRTFGMAAFYACDKLKDIFIGNPIPPDEIAEPYFYQPLFSDYSATLHVPKNSIPDYRMSSVWSKFTIIVDDASDVGDVAAEHEIGFTVSGGVLTVTGVDGAMIEIYDMSGRRVYEGVSPVVSGLPRGIYLLKAGNRTAKIRI